MTAGMITPVAAEPPKGQPKGSIGSLTSEIQDIAGFIKRQLEEIRALEESIDSLEQKIKDIEEHIAAVERKIDALEDLNRALEELAPKLLGALMNNPNDRFVDSRVAEAELQRVLGQICELYPEVKDCG
jgi:chromosome segregation ATPase